MSAIDLAGRCLVPGHGGGPVLRSDVPLSFWMGVDSRTGEVIDRHHPLRGAVVTGKVVVLPSGRGSCSGSCALLELIVNGRAPAALVFEHDEAILTLGAIVGDEVFGRTIPIASVGSAGFAELRGAPHLVVRDGRVTAPSDAASDDETTRGPRPAGATGPALTDADRAVLAGADGRARQAALTIVVRMAGILGASALVDVEQAHIDGCFYTGPAGLSFVETLRDWGGRVKVPATTNAMSVDRRRWQSQGVPPVLGEAAVRVADAYVGMGVRPTFTCAPYLLDGAPRIGQQIAWGESNAVAYANSVLGARTMKYPDFLDICIALTGRAPLAGCHTETGRRATLRIDVPDLGPLDDAFYPLLGYHTGLVAAHDIPAITGLETRAPSPDDLKAFSAAFATTSAAAMFHIVGVTPEAATLDEAAGGTVSLPTVTLTAADLLRSWRELNSARDPDVNLVCLGNPHFSLGEFSRAAGLCPGRTKAPGVEVIVTCGRAVHDEAERAGFVAALEAFGARILNDTCWCMIEEPVLPVDARTLVTNSAKFAHYGPGTTGRGIHFTSLAGCLDAAATGIAPSGPPSWLATAAAA